MIYTLNTISKKIKEQKKKGKRVGLITGCFDVLHVGHVQFFRLAKKNVDFLVVALDNDKTISLSKGKNRPINKIKHRLEVVAEIKSVDAVLSISHIFDVRKKTETVEALTFITQKINPDYLITNKIADDFWKEKMSRAKKLKIGFILIEEKRPTSSTYIINRLNIIK